MRGRRAATIVLLMTLLPGCAWWQQRSRTTKGAVYGTGAGAATGAAIGGILGGGEGAAKGAAIGAVVGGLSGTAIGYYMDQQKNDMEQVLERQDRIEREGETLRIALGSDVLFDSGKSTLQPGAQDKLREVAGVLNRYPRTSIEIVGHTDGRGSESSNRSLSERRAAAVRDALVRDGISPSRITARGAGETRPVATNDTPEGRAQNRRVEIVTRADESFAEEERTRGAPPPAPQDEPR